MPKEYEMTEIQLWGVQLLGSFFDALRSDQLSEFLKSDDLASFLRETGAGPYFGKVPAGTPRAKFPDNDSTNMFDVPYDVIRGPGGFGQIPSGLTGSNFPGAGSNPLDGQNPFGSQNPLEILHGIFQGLGFDLGKIDHSGGIDPAATPDGGTTPATTSTTHDDGHGNVTDVTDDHQGNVAVHTQHSDGSAEDFSLSADGSSSGSKRDVNGRIEYFMITMDRQGGGFTIERGYHDTDGSNERRSSHYGADGQQHSPGEDGGGDTNTAPSPLSGVAIGGPQSAEQMLNQMQYPGQDPNELDQNTGLGGLKLTEADKEGLGWFVPALEVLDPNSGIEPLAQLNIDPNQIHARSEDDDRIDPNTGLQPLPTPNKETE